MSLAELMPLVERLNQVDRLQLINFLLRQQSKTVVDPSVVQSSEMGMADSYGICSDVLIAKVVDLNRFSGVIQLKGDALELQLQMRNEWI